MKFKNNLPKGLVLVGLADTIGNGFSALFWLIIASLLLPNEYGEISYFIGIAGIISMVALFGTQNSIVVYNAKNVNLNFTFNTISILIGIIGLIAIGLIANRFDVGFLIIGYIIHILGTGYILGKKKYYYYVILVILQKFLTFALGLGFYFTFGSQSLLLALALSYVGYSIIIIKGFQDSTFNLTLLKEKIKFISNNYMLSISTGLNSQIDKLLIGPILGFVILGNYALALQIVTILFVIPGIVYKYTLSHDASGIRNQQLKRYTIILSVITCIITIIFAPIIIPELFPKYENVIIAIQIMSVSVIPSTIVIFYTSKLLGMEKNKLVLIANLIQTSVFITSLIILGQIFGVIGLAFSFVLAQTIEFLIYFSMRKKF
tara:strand:+ start:1140 stop:2267 length:1128 start_codon:yes stop_codon:yes gene_type:complete